MGVDDVPPTSAPSVDTPPAVVQPATAPEVPCDYPRERGSAAVVDASTGPVAMETKTEVKPRTKSDKSGSRSAAVAGVDRSRSRSEGDQGRASTAEGARRARPRTDLSDHVHLLQVQVGKLTESSRAD